MNVEPATALQRLEQPAISVERLERLELLERLEPGQWMQGEAKWNDWNRLNSEKIKMSRDFVRKRAFPIGEEQDTRPDQNSGGGL